MHAFLKHYRTGVLGLLGISLLSLSFVFPESTASNIAKAILWGFLGTLIFLFVGVLIFLGNRLRKKKTKVEDAKKPEALKQPSSGVGGALLDAFTHPLTLSLWLAMFGGVWLYSHNLLTTPNWTWVPLILWALFVLLSKAGVVSMEKSAGKGKEKKADPGLASATKIIFRLAFISTVAVIAYYGHFAPDGTWGKLTGRVGVNVLSGPNEMLVPKGVPLNPTFTSVQLEHNWNVTYIAANPQYKVPQAAWAGKKLMLAKEPGREITEVVNLTIQFGPGFESLDIHLSGSCQAVVDRRNVSKTCVGRWIDRGAKISGQFYLEVKEGGESRYINAYLYDGNYLPRNKNFLELFISGPPIPDIMLQFRPRDWSREKG